MNKQKTKTNCTHCMQEKFLEKLSVCIVCKRLNYLHIWCDKCKYLHAKENTHQGEFIAYLGVYKQ